VGGGKVGVGVANPRASYIYICMYNYNMYNVCTLYDGGKNCGSSIFESEILVFILKTERNLHLIFGVFDF
jgi:hypothetical protein